MGEVAELVRDSRLVAVVNAPLADYLFDWAIAVAKGGIKLLGIPVTFPQVTEVTSDLADEANLAVGVSGVTTPEHVSIAIAAGADFILSPVCNPPLIKSARDRGLAVIAGGATPTEILRCIEEGADLTAVFPARSLGGPAYVADIVREVPRLPLVVSGSVDVETAPNYLEAGAIAAIVDRGLFPEDEDPSAAEVITVRARMLTEVCGEVSGRSRDETLTRIVTRRPPPK